MNRQVNVWGLLAMFGLLQNEPLGSYWYEVAHRWLTKYAEITPFRPMVIQLPRYVHGPDDMRPQAVVRSLEWVQERYGATD